MTMTRDDMRTWIRLHLELDAADLDDSLIDSHLRAATTKVHSTFTDWQFFEEIWTFTTVASQSDYSLLTDLTATNTADAVVAPNGIRRVKLSDRILERVTFSMLDRMDADRSNSGGDPYNYALWGNQISLYPTPSDAQTVTIRGYREGIDWIGSNVAADVPLDMEEVILFWALGEAYAQQDDAQSSLHWYDMAEHIMDRAMKKYIEAPFEDDIVINAREIGDRNVPHRLRYPWE